MTAKTDLSSLEKIILFIKADLNGCIKGGVNISLALVLSAYTEFFGHLLTGLFGRGSCKTSYEEWLKFMGSEYGKMLDKVELYDKVRCGLVHEYTTKGTAQIFTKEGYPAIEVKNGVIHFNNQQYTQDFIRSIDKYYEKIKMDSTLQRNFENFRKGKPIVM